MTVQFSPDGGKTWTDIQSGVSRTDAERYIDLRQRPGYDYRIKEDS